MIDNLKMYLTGTCDCAADFNIKLIIQANGIKRYHLCCSLCKQICGKPIAHHKLNKTVREEAEVVRNYTDAREKCVRCGSVDGVEIHHWAPVSRFDDWWLWPTSKLCRACHAFWHRKMR